jgi:hypothetical protein
LKWIIYIVIAAVVAAVALRLFNSRKPPRQ